MKKLPDEYIVKCDEDAKKCKKVYSNFYNDEFEPSGWNYIVCSPQIKNAQFLETGKYPSGYCIENKIRDEFAHLPVLTYKEWKKLKQMKKEIIGYRLVKPEYEKAALVVTKCTGCGWSVSPLYDISADSRGAEMAKAAGVLDLWFEPVYKEKEFEFEFGRWYKGTGERLYFITGKCTGYGFDSSGNWVNFGDDGIAFGFNRFTPATDTEVKERLLAYAMEKYAVGTRYKSAYTHTLIEEVSEQKFEVQDCLQRVYGEEGKGCLLYFGKWAEIISEPEKKVTIRVDGNELYNALVVAEVKKIKETVERLENLM